MGKFEQEASRKVLAREPITLKTRFSLKDFLLRPLRAYRQKKREAEIRKTIFKTSYPKNVVS